MLKSLIFDCDGVLVDTERDGHRVAFNRAFMALGLDVFWSVELYGKLLATAGGKERIRRYFDEYGWPVPEAERDATVAALHKCKTGLFMDFVSGGPMPLRAGVARLIDEAIAAGLTLAVCSTSNEQAVRAVVATLGPERARHISVFAGDAVAAKKPDPAIYRLAITTLGLDPNRTVVIEDSENGLRAALGAGLRCIVTTSSYTAEENFNGAALVVPELGDGEGTRIRLDDCVAACTAANQAAG